MLPPEIWGVIINFLGKDEQRTCLFVSKLHHDITIFYLFSSVTLHFGMWQKSDYEEDEQEQSVLEEIEQRSTNTCELLRYVSRTPTFASYIRRLYVRPYATGDGNFELRLLEEALEAMYNLRSFYWHHRTFFMPQPFVLDALVKSSGPLLTEICLPYDAALKLPLCRLPNLRALRLVHDAVTAPEEYESSQSRDLVSGLEASSIALTHLSVYPGSAIRDFPIRTLFGLQELELVQAEDLSGLTLVFHHCTALRSLALCNLSDPSMTHQLVPLLTAFPEALPDLTALKILSGKCTYQLTVAVSAFLANKWRLRMLDLTLNRHPDSLEPQIWDSLSLCKLPALEVLGFDVQANSWSDIEIQRIDHSIPLHLSALLINASVQILQPYLQALPRPQEWLNLIRKRTSLRYLHILDSQRDMDLKQQLLEDHPDSLELVGYGPCLRWILRDDFDSAADRHPNDPSAGPYYSALWPFEKVEHRTAEDFGCAEWEWLLRHHDSASLDDLCPGIPY